MSKHISKQLSNRNNYMLLGLPFDAVTLEEAAHIIEGKIALQERCFLSTPNINFVISALQDPQFYESVVLSDLSVMDGMPLVWLAKLCGLPISERVAGSDLFQLLSEKQREKPIRVFFFGGEAGIAEIAHHKLNESSIGMVSVGYHDPGFVDIDEMSTPAVLDKINAAQADFLLVALGAKKGQAWIMQNKDALNASVISHLGAVINFVAGSVKRAPDKWQKFGLEWLWRIKQEPGLWKRYWSDGWCLLKLLITKLLPYQIYDRYYRSRQISYPQCISRDENKVHLSGRFDQHNTASFMEQIDGDKKVDLLLDMGDVDYVDAHFLATLVILRGLLKQQKSELIISDLHPNIRRLLRLSGAAGYLNDKFRS